MSLTSWAHGALTLLSTENQGSAPTVGEEKVPGDRWEVSLLKDLITSHVQMVGYPMTLGKGQRKPYI